MYAGQTIVKSPIEQGMAYAASFGLGRHATDLSPLLGQDARGLHVLGASYKPRHETWPLMDGFPAVAQNGLKAEVILITQDAHTQRLWVLKRMFWLCRVDVNYKEEIATIVSMSDNKAFSAYGLNILAQKLMLEEDKTGVRGLEELLAERTKEIIVKMPKPRRAVILGDSEQTSE